MIDGVLTFVEDVAVVVPSPGMNQGAKYVDVKSQVKCIVLAAQLLFANNVIRWVESSI